ncbi:DUF2332 domain-containing protein [Microbacterium sp. CFBP9034]|uniref:DUF2332 domain-containing protein n=1 Tax=Microbacterium sp. CFBP9034 TaxID=3096540 RepID=UPI002A6ABAB5|nr:DUF2332 domain-containing protein [Microbacterium sp. CFBP9034]MDY0909077.1 DUF2332 domain-containing protein [Microbacterium sp. CFBP9034]
MAAQDDAARIAAIYDDFGRRWAHGTSPLYEDWALGIAGDTDVVERLADLPRAKQQPNLVFASMRWEGCPLLPYIDIRAWLIEHWAGVVSTGATWSVQTNEANRCATWLPPLSRIEGPIALLEVGAAAGLCLFPDRYSVDYRTPAGVRRVHPPAGPSDVLLACTVDSETSVPARWPDVVWRRGIDLEPIDAADDGAIDWLANLVWPGPDHDARVARLRAAAAIAAADPPEIVRGDLLERVTDVAALAPAEATLVVFHSAVLLYLDAGQRRRFAELMAGLEAEIGRRVVWLSNETMGTLPEIDAQVPAGTATDHRFVQTWNERAIALAGQHGAVYETAPFAE